MKNTTAFRFLIITAVILNLFYLLGQTTAVFFYSFPESIGLQEPMDEITEVGVALNKGFGLGDTLIYSPLFIIGIIGLLKDKVFGIYCMTGALAITAYWPVVALSTLYFAKGSPGWGFTDYTSYTILLTLITLYGVWGIWFLYSRYGRTTTQLSPGNETK